MERGHANASHIQHFTKLLKHPGFTGYITPGQTTLFSNSSVSQDKDRMEHCSSSESFTNDDTVLHNTSDDVDDDKLNDITYQLLAISTDQDSQQQSSSEDGTIIQVVR